MTKCYVCKNELKNNGYKTKLIISESRQYRSRAYVRKRAQNVIVCDKCYEDLYRQEIKIHLWDEDKPVKLYH